MSVPVQCILQFDLGEQAADAVSEILQFQQDATPTIQTVTVPTTPGLTIPTNVWTTIDYILIHNKSTSATVDVSWTHSGVTQSFVVPAGGMAIWHDTGNTGTTLTLVGSAAAACEILIVGSR